jgi:hypothetical protein
MSDLISKAYSACGSGDLAAIKSFLKTIEFEKSDQNTKEMMLTEAIKYEHIEMLDFLITQYKRVRYQHCISTASQIASQMGKLNILEEFFDKYPDDKYFNQCLLSGNMIAPAIRNGYLDIVKYLICKENFNKHLKEKPTLLESFFLIAYTKKQFTILHYLISDLNIEITPYINNFIEKSSDVARLFELKDLNKNLNEELANQKQDKSLNKKNKI